MFELSPLDIDHALRCMVENMLDNLPMGIENEQFEIIQFALEDALERINDELCDLEEGYAMEEE